MSEVNTSDHERPRPPTPGRFEETVRFIAENDTSKVYFGHHAFERVDERSISTRDAIDVLRYGYVDGEIEQGKNPGEWKATISRQIRGNREAGVVTILINEEEIFIKTVMWMDL